MIEATYFYRNNPSRRISLSYIGKGLSFLLGDEAKSFVNILKHKNVEDFGGIVTYDGVNLLDPSGYEANLKTSIIEASDKGTIVSKTQVENADEVDTYDVRNSCEKYLEIYDVDKELHNNFYSVFESIYTELTAKGNYIVLDLSETRRNFAFGIVDLLGKILKTYPIFVYAPTLYEGKGKTLWATNDPEKLLHPMLEYEDSSYLSKELALTTIIDTLEEEQPKENLLTAPQREKAFLWTSMGLSAGALATVSVLFGLRHSYGIFMVCIFIEVICASVASGLLIYANAKKKQKHIYQNLLLSISLGVCTLMFTICGILPYIIWGANLRNAYEGYYYIVPSVIGLANVAAIWFSMYFGNHVFFGSPAGKKKKE